MTHDVFVYPKPNIKGHDGYFIEFDSRPSEAPPLLETLKRFILRSKVRIQDASDEYDVWSIWGSEDVKKKETRRKWAHARSGVIEPVWEPSREWPWTNGADERPSLFDRRAVGMGTRVLVRKGDKRELKNASCSPCTDHTAAAEASTHDEARAEEYAVHRILHGVPEGIVDIPPMQAFPMESNLDIMGGRE